MVTSMTALNMFFSFMVACVCVWTVLTSRLRTTSLEILALGTIFIGAMLNIETPLHTGSITEPGEIFTNIGISLYGLFVCLRLTLKPFVDRLYKRLQILERFNRLGHRKSTEKTS